MRRSIARRRQRKCINLMELVRNRCRYQPYDFQSCSSTSRTGSRSTSRSHSNTSSCTSNPFRGYSKCGSILTPYSFGLRHLPFSMAGGSRRDSVQFVPKTRHISTSTQCRHMQRVPTANAPCKSRIDRAVSTHIACQSVHTQYEPCEKVSVATSSMELDVNIDSSTSTAESIITSANVAVDATACTSTDETQTTCQEVHNVAAATTATSTSTLRTSTVDRSTSHIALRESSDSSPSEQAPSHSDSEEILPQEIEIRVVGAEESTESDDDDEEEEEENASANEESASENTVADSHSNLALQVQEANVIDEAAAAAAAAGGVELADEEAGGDGHHNNSVIEIEITLRSSNDTNSEEDDDEEEEEEEEADAALDEESE